MKKWLIRPELLLFILLTTLLLSCGNGDEIVIKNRLTTGGKSPTLINGYSPLESFRVQQSGVYRIEIDSRISSVIIIDPPFSSGYVWDGNSSGYFIYETFFPFPGMAAIRQRFLESAPEESFSSTIKIKRLDIERLELGEMGELKFSSGWNEENMGRKEGYRHKFCWYLVEIEEPGSYLLKLESDKEVMVSLKEAYGLVSLRHYEGKIINGRGEISRPGLYVISCIVSFDEELDGRVGLFKE